MRFYAFCVALIMVAFTTLSILVRAQESGRRSLGEHEDDEVLTIDHFVPHISTVPATAGQRVELFVRERVLGGDVEQRDQDGHDGRRPVVLMVHGSTQSSVASFDLPFENYSWSAFLARAGFDAFVMDQTGYGSSPRPTMDDPCNASTAQQQMLLIPNPLATTCSPSYPFALTTSQSDWDEIDTVVDYVRQIRGVEKVNLIGWSLGGPRMGGYAARHPDKVARMVLDAPNYNRLEPTDPPAHVPDPGVPLQVRTIASFLATWDSQVHCDNQFTPEIRDVIRHTILESDPLGSTWGTQDLWRAPLQTTRWGWNPLSAGVVEAPTLLIRGDLDTQVPVDQVTNLYQDLGTFSGLHQKVFVHVACAAHQLVWENRHLILLQASAEWLRHGTFDGHHRGSFFVDADGVVHRE